MILHPALDSGMICLALDLILKQLMQAGLQLRWIVHSAAPIMKFLTGRTWPPCPVIDTGYIVPAE